MAKAMEILILAICVKYSFTSDGKTCNSDFIFNATNLSCTPCPNGTFLPDDGHQIQICFQKCNAGELNPFCRKHYFNLYQGKMVCQATGYTDSVTIYYKETMKKQTLFDKRNRKPSLTAELSAQGGEALSDYKCLVNYSSPNEKLILYLDQTKTLDNGKFSTTNGAAASSVFNLSLIFTVLVLYFK